MMLEDMEDLKAGLYKMLQNTDWVKYTRFYLRKLYENWYLNKTSAYVDATALFCCYWTSQSKEVLNEQMMHC